jgi:hypothetical protein
MSRAEKYQIAQRLRAEAEAIRRHGLTNFFEHTFACLRFGQVMKEREEDRCGLCPMREFVRSDYRDESFPWQPSTGTWLISTPPGWSAPQSSWSRRRSAKRIRRSPPWLRPTRLSPISDPLAHTTGPPRKVIIGLFIA